MDDDQLDNLIPRRCIDCRSFLEDDEAQRLHRAHMPPRCRPCHARYRLHLYIGGDIQLDRQMFEHYYAVGYGTSTYGPHEHARLAAILHPR